MFVDTSGTASYEIGGNDSPTPYILTHDSSILRNTPPERAAALFNSLARSSQTNKLDNELGAGRSDLLMVILEEQIRSQGEY